MKESLKSIYAIECPIEKEVIYIGQAWSVKTRRLSHRNKKSQHKGKINSRIQQILDFALEPIIYEIDIVPESQSHYWELYYIEQMEQWGFTLLNIQRKYKKAII